MNMISAFHYLSPKSAATMSRLDRTIVAVHEDSPDSPTVPATENMIADVKLFNNSNQRAKNQFRPRVGKGGATSYQLRQYAEVTLGGGSLRKVVKLPEGEDENEWLAVNSEPRLQLQRASAVANLCSGGFLQPDQPALRRNYGILFAPIMP